jgi:integrase
MTNDPVLVATLAEYLAQAGKGRRGDGRLFVRGTSLWCAFCVDGVEQRESCHTRQPKAAVVYLRKRLKVAGVHELDPSEPFLTQRDRKRTVCELMDALRADFERRGKASPQNLSNVRRVQADFGRWRALGLTAADVDAYIERRLAADYQPASVNRTLQLLRQAYQLAKLPAPAIPQLSEAGNERRGFFSAAEIRRVIDNLPADLGDFVEFAWCTGMRKGEIASLAWEDLDGDVLRLRGENAKNGEPRLIPLEGELAELIERRRARRQVKVEDRVMLASLIFHRRGEPIV